ncbi:hypothetical protein [Paraburkholderia sp. J7]|uniref:hypothetical protein n=1 Tax=Paraburkholderia sp. J7 TaxID=2805438 RepID=UPI002AB6CB39|nr:hypothetical protein [Paraburkholderia sp. J7]
MTLKLIAFIRQALLIVPLAAALGGCMTSTPIWDAHFGDAVRTSMRAQIIDPDAAQHASSPLSIDGKAADSAMTLYDKSYQQPPVADHAYSMGVNGSAGQ